MKFVTHQTTLHLSFKIKCCVDQLRPPPESGRGRIEPSCRLGAQKRNNHHAKNGCGAPFSPFRSITEMHDRISSSDMFRPNCSRNTDLNSASSFNNRRMSY